jgi:hypothetical protein
MADIVLAEHRGQSWLVSGERYIDDLLGNTLPTDVSIEIVACEFHADVNALWVRNRGEEATSGSPWMIHPAIVNRVRKAPPVGNSIVFGQWSVQLDDKARSVITASADRARASSTSDVVLTSFIAPDGSQIVKDLATLRGGMIEAELIALGVSQSRIIRATRDSSDGEGAGEATGRIDIIINID